MSTLSRDVDAVRARQTAIAGKHTCGPRPAKGMRQKWIQPCPFYAQCRDLPLNVDALCELSDEQSGIDTMTENPFGGWSFELTVKAKKVIDDPLDFGEDEQHE